MYLQGMVDAGENVSVTLKREFSEEALNALEATPEERKRIETSITDLFSKGTEVKIYVYYWNKIISEYGMFP